MKNLTLFTLLALMTATILSCGGGQKAKQSELNNLREQVRAGAKDEQLLLDTRGEAVTTRGQLRRLASDDLRQDPSRLEQRLQDTGTRIGLHKVRRLQNEGLKEGERDLDWRLYKIRARGHNDKFQRWLQDMINWPVGISPVKLVSQKDSIGNFEHEYTFAIPEWELPGTAPSPAEPPEPGSPPDGDVEYELWRLRQNMDRIEEARKVLPANQAELKALQSIMDQLGELDGQDKGFVEALSDILSTTKRAGSLQGFSIEPHMVEVTAIVLNENALNSYLGYLEDAGALENAEVATKERTKLGLRCVVRAQIASGG